MVHSKSSLSLFISDCTVLQYIVCVCVRMYTQCLSPRVLQYVVCVVSQVDNSGEGVCVCAVVSCRSESLCQWPGQSRVQSIKAHRLIGPTVQPRDPALVLQGVEPVCEGLAAGSVMMERTVAALRVTADRQRHGHGASQEQVQSRLQIPCRPHTHLAHLSVSGYVNGLAAPWLRQHRARR